MSPRAYRTTWGWYSSQSRSRSSSWLQNGCLTWEAAPVLKLGSHPAMERPAILNRSIPSTTGATMRIVLAIKNAIYTFEKEYARWRAVSPGSAWLIPIFRIDFPCFTSKIVEYSRYLPHPVSYVVNWVKVRTNQRQ